MLASDPILTMLPLPPQHAPACFLAAAEPSVNKIPPGLLDRVERNLSGARHRFTRTLLENHPPKIPIELRNIARICPAQTHRTSPPPASQFLDVAAVFSAPARLISPASDPPRLGQRQRHRAPPSRWRPGDQGNAPVRSKSVDGIMNRSGEPSRTSDEHKRPV